jgi:hypothetical protein
MQISDVAPDFEADTTEGRLRFHDWIGIGNTMIKSLAPALVMFPLLGTVGMVAAVAATNGPLGILKSHTPIVKVEEACGNGYFRDGSGNCRPWYGGESAHRPREGCPWDRHFVHWANHEGGYCQSNY